MARAKLLFAHDPLRRWTAADANDTYNIPRWGCGYFNVNDLGNLVVTPRGETGGQIDMKELINDLAFRSTDGSTLGWGDDLLQCRRICAARWRLRCYCHAAKATTV